MISDGFVNKLIKLPDKNPDIAWLFVSLKKWFSPQKRKPFCIQPLNNGKKLPLYSAFIPSYLYKLEIDL